MEAEAAAAPAPSIRARLREKWPELVLEAGSVMFAVLLALAIDAWQDERQRAELAARALAAIAAELAANRDEARATVEGARTALAALAPLAAAAGEPPAGTELALGYELALVSDAAWSTAQASQALHVIAFEESTRLARVYELQGWFEQAQRAGFERLGELTVVDRDDWPAAQRAMRTIGRELGIVVTLGEELIAAYDGALAADSAAIDVGSP
jgi:hypothetical protein